MKKYILGVFLLIFGVFFSSGAYALPNAPVKAGSYVYSDYTNNCTFTVNNSNVVAEYSPSKFNVNSLLNDLARYLGALKRYENSPVTKIKFEAKEYVWSLTGATPEKSNLKGSNWRESEGSDKTLVSAIAVKFATNAGLNNIDIVLFNNTGTEFSMNLSYKIKNEIPNSLKKAKEYVYEAPNAYTYNGLVSLTGNHVEGAYKKSEVSNTKKEILDDLARYLGALKRYENSPVTKIKFEAKEYVWSLTGATPEKSNLKGSNWRESEGSDKTLVEYMNTFPRTSFQLTIEDSFNNSLNATLSYRLMGTGAELKNIIMSGTALSGFNSSITGYNIKLPAGTTTYPLLTGLSLDPKSNVQVLNDRTFPGKSIIEVKSEDGSLAKRYELNFTLEEAPSPSLPSATSPTGSSSAGGAGGASGTYCGDSLVQKPNDDGIFEECDGGPNCNSKCKIIDNSKVKSKDPIKKSKEKPVKVEDKKTDSTKKEDKVRSKKTKDYIFNPSIKDGYCHTRKANFELYNTSKYANNMFNVSYIFMYAYDIVNKNNVGSFNPDEKLTRKEASKLFSDFATNVLCRKANTKLKVNYSDLAGLSDESKKHIEKAYQLGLMKGDKNGSGLFKPNDQISEIEFNVVLIRLIIKSYLPETPNPWYKNYELLSNKLGIISKNSNKNSIKKSDAAIALFKAYRKQKYSLKGTGYILDSIYKLLK